MRKMAATTQSGFSYIDLLVAIATVAGVIALIVIPNYETSREKTYQAEAKSHLSGIYVAEKSFFARYKGYHSSLSTIGFTPKGFVHYNVGFGSDGEIPAEFKSLAPADTLSTKWICGGEYGFGPDTDCNMLADTPDIDLNSTVTTNDFNANAVAFESEFANRHQFKSSLIAKLFVGSDSHSEPSYKVACMIQTGAHEIWAIDSAKKVSYKKVDAIERMGSPEECKSANSSF